VLVPHLTRLAKAKKPDDRLFGVPWRDWPREWVKRIYDKAGVPVVCAHAMRGAHASLARESQRMRWPQGASAAWSTS
jgi:integrase